MKFLSQGRAALLRGPNFWRRGSAALPAIATILFLAFSAAAQTTNNLSDAEIHGQQLAQQLYWARPETNFTQRGLLQVHSSRTNFSVPVVFFISFPPLPTNCATCVPVWVNCYAALFDQYDTNRAAEIAGVYHMPGQPNEYSIQKPERKNLTGSETAVPFANSDFWVCDLGLEFFHWPDQKILRGETMRGVFCKVLESTNPNPPTNGYSRVVSWIDNESLGIVQAKAYDAKGNPLKEFYPKDIKKVNGMWQVGSMEIDNVQTRSRTVLKFDLKPN